jgi:carbonic anhydrase
MTAVGRLVKQQTMWRCVAFVCALVAVFVVDVDATTGYAALTTKAPRLPVWSYDDRDRYGPSHWGDKYFGCRPFDRQSPIDIEEQSLVHKKKCPDLNFTVFERSPGNDEMFVLQNTGEGVTILMKGYLVVIVEGYYKYRLEKIEFHWGNNNKNGSEHSLAGQRYAMEIQFHLKRVGYTRNTVELGLQYAIMSVFAEATSSRPNSDAIQLVSERLNLISKPGATDVMKAFSMSTLLPPAGSRQYFRYQGGLTEPPCSLNENVVWIILQQPIAVDPNLPRKFGTTINAVGGKPLISNVRPLQLFENVPMFACGTRPLPVPGPNPPDKKSSAPRLASAHLNVILAVQVVAAIAAAALVASVGVAAAI